MVEAQWREIRQAPPRPVAPRAPEEIDEVDAPAAPRAENEGFFRIGDRVRKFRGGPNNLNRTGVVVAFYRGNPNRLVVHYDGDVLPVEGTFAWRWAESINFARI